MRIPRYIISLNHTHTTVVHSGFIATPTHNKLVASLLSSSDHERQTFGTVCHCSHGGRCGDIVCVYPGWRTDGESWTNQGDQCWKSLIHTTGKPKSVNYNILLNGRYDNATGNCIWSAYSLKFCMALTLVHILSGVETVKALATTLFNLKLILIICYKLFIAISSSSLELSRKQSYAYISA